jgi:hypothetical protein
MLFLCRENGNTEVCGVVEGDDGLFVMEGEPPEGKLFEEFGAIIKLVKHDCVSEASFCGIVADEIVRDVITDPIKVIQNTGWTNRQYLKSSDQTLKALLRAKGYSLLSQYAGCPIVQELGLCCLRVTEGVTFYKMLKTINKKNMSVYEKERMKTNLVIGARQKPVHINSRFLMEKVFGISVEDQCSIEARLKSVREIGPIYLPEAMAYCHVHSEDYYSKYFFRDAEAFPDV